MEADADMKAARAIGTELLLTVQRGEADAGIALMALAMVVSAVIASAADGQPPYGFLACVTEGRNAFVESLDSMLDGVRQRGPMDPTGAWGRDV